MSGPAAASEARIAVVVPCFRVRDTVLAVLGKIGPEVTRIYCVDDACPDHSGDRIEAECRDSRVVVLRHAENGGVGAATLTGYEKALADGMEIVVKLDGDGQMDPGLIPRFVAPLASGAADYSKGNRFYDPDDALRMPKLRLFGNLVLSFLTKLSSGYWPLFDPTNGYTAIHREALQRLPLRKVARGYFFESDLLFRLNIIRAVVEDVQMPATYGTEHSSLRISRILLPFLWGHARNLLKRVIYCYFLRDFHLASVELLLGAALVTFGAVFGGYAWAVSVSLDSFASAGTVMLAALPLLVGTQLLLAALSYDMQNVPRRPLSAFAASSYGRRHPL